MHNYRELLNDIIENGTNRGDRTGVGSRYIWGTQLNFDLSNGFPATVCRPVPLRWAFEETMFFLRGETQTTILEDKGVSIWKGNTSREFLDGRGLHWLPTGDMGKGYGHQWRNFGGLHGIERQYDASPENDGLDQIVKLIDGLKNDPENPVKAY